MSNVALRYIDRVEALPGYRLLVTWTEGRQMTLDFSEDIKRGGIWAALASPEAFARARTARNGRVLEWPEPTNSRGEPAIDVDADGLFEMGIDQQATPCGVAAARADS